MLSASHSSNKKIVNFHNSIFVRSLTRIYYNTDFYDAFKNMTLQKQSVPALLTSILLVIGCTDKDPENIIPQPVYLVTYEQQFIRSADQIAALTGLAGLSSLSEYIDYDINLYKITYKTYYLEQEVYASGLVSFPETVQAMPMLSFQHGTITKHSEAPTEDLTTYGFISSLASAGYIFLVPDYIGFGSSSDILHPYYHAATTANSVRNMLIAAKELAELEGYFFNGDVFLGGYSEGGYATMATHKSMEENPMEGFQLIASAPASGGYDVKGMQEYFFSLETYDEPYYLAYVALSYSFTYDWPDILGDLFREPYASAIPGLFDGTFSGGDINRNLTNVIEDLIQPDLLLNIDTDAGYAYIVDAFVENSLHDWVPMIPMYLYHGTEDITVPYQNSTEAYEHMLDLGASPEIVKLIPLEGATHGTGAIPYMVDIIEKFDALKSINQ